LIAIVVVFFFVIGNLLCLQKGLIGTLWCLAHGKNSLETANVGKLFQITLIPSERYDWRIWGVPSKMEGTVVLETSGWFDR